MATERALRGQSAQAQRAGGFIHAPHGSGHGPISSQCFYPRGAPRLPRGEATRSSSTDSRAQHAQVRRPSETAAPARRPAPASA
eukprot:6762102-Pyramimonas_sp.AAC.1